MTTLQMVDQPIRSEVDLFVGQLRGINRWNQARGAYVGAQAVAAASREKRAALERRMEVLREEHEAIVERTETHLRESVRLLTDRAPLRAVLAHHDDRFARKLSASLERQGVEVVACLDNGAHAIGCVVAEQPDLLLVEDLLTMLSGVEVIREAGAFAPDTHIGVRVEDQRVIGDMLDAGAQAAWTRGVPVGEVSDGLLELLTVS